MELDEVATRVDRLAAELTTAGARLPYADPGARAFAAGGPGALFALGGALHIRWARALSAREREAAAHGARLADLGARLREAAEGYRDVEQAAQRRHARGVT